MGHDEVTGALLRIVADESAQRKLADCADVASLAATLGEMDDGAFDWAGHLEAAARLADQPPAWEMPSAPPRQWLPVQLYFDGMGLQVEWLHFAFAPLREPFFEQSARQARHHPMNLLLRCTTPVEALRAFAGDADPDVLVFHMSRCGSTLVGQVLASLDQVTTVAESPPLDAALRLWLEGALDAGLVRGIANALARDRDGSNGHRVIKLDAWHSLSLNRIADLFPAARTLFLFRDPIEVLVSHVRRPGMHVQRGAVSLESFGLHGAESVTDEEFAAWVIGAIARGGQAAAGRTGLSYCDYAQWPETMGMILNHLGIPGDQAVRTRIEEASRRYSKDPGRAFVPDAEDKQAAADPVLRAFASKHHLPSTYVALRRLAASEPSRTIRDLGHGAVNAPRIHLTVTYR